MKIYFLWEYNEKAPFIEMLKFSRKYRDLHLYEVVDDGTTFYTYIFAENAATAKQQLFEALYEDSYPVKNAVKVKKCF